MPSTVASLLTCLRLRASGSVPWKSAIKTLRPGVYLVSRSADAHRSSDPSQQATFDRNALHSWIRNVTTLCVDKVRCTDTLVLEARLTRYWIPDENILYIGKATSLRSRIGAYYTTPLGARGPHAGGHWIKTLSTLNQLHVHFAETKSINEAEGAEEELIKLFSSSVSESSRSRLPRHEDPLPFANLKFPNGARKGHGISGATC